MRLHTICYVLPLVCTPLLAQEGAAEMGPAKEVKAFHKLLGTWEGSGTVKPEPDVPPMKWTATSHNTSVLGGHFVQEDLHIEFHGDQAPPAFAMRTLYGFDRETKKFKVFTLTNMGTAEEQQVHWVDGKMMTGGAKTDVGMDGTSRFVVERWSTTFEKDSYTIIGYETIGNGKPFQHVQGTFKRVKIANASFNAKKIGPMVPVAKQMGALHKQSGSYDMKGWMIMMPGMPKTDITASEEVYPIFGGSALEFRLKGDPIPNMGTYEGYGAMVWSQSDNCYKSFWADNMGSASLTNAHLVDNKLVWGQSGPSMGQLWVRSAVLTLKKDGSLDTITEHAAVNGSAPEKNFHASYTKK